MKSQRRQELKTNDLSVYLQQLSEQFHAHASKIILVAVLAVTVVGAVLYRNHRLTQSRQQGWLDYEQARRASFSAKPDKVGEITRTWESILATYDDPKIVGQSAWALAAFCLKQFVLSDDRALKEEMLDKARQNCQLIVDNYRNNPPLYAAAMNGLAVVEQNRYLITGDPESQARARRYLEQIRDESAFLASPFQSEALVRLNEFETLWQPVELVEPPPDKTAPSDAADAVEDDADALTSEPEEEESLDPELSSEQAPE